MTERTRRRGSVLVVLAAGCLLALAAGMAFAGVAADPIADADPAADGDAGTTMALADDDGPIAQAGGSGGQVSGSPALDLFLSQPTVPTGGTSQVTVDVLNTGEMRFGNELDPRVTTARGLRLEAEADDDDPIEVESGTIAVGDVATGAPTSVPIDIAVPDDTPDGEYDVEVTARYRFTAQVLPESTNHNDRRGTDRFDVTVVVDDGARFAFVDAETDAQVGGDGDVRATLENVGEETARDAVVSGTASGSGVQLGVEGAGSDVFVGDWEPGENRTVTFDSTVGPDFASERYVLRSTVEYRNRDGTETTSPASRVGVTPIPEQSFDVADVEGTLEVGYSGTVSGTISNDGPLAVEDAVLVAEPQSARVSLGEDRYALPDLADGESVDFSFDADVSGQADPGPRQVRFTVEYTAGDATMTASSSDRVQVDPRRPEFDVSSDGTSIPAGETRRVTFEITNQRPESLSSINAGLYADSPLTAVEDDAFVDELAPGESTEIWFEVAAARGANERTYPVELDFRYDDERGNDRISDVTQYPIDVTEPVDDDDGLPIVPIVIGVLVLVAVGGGAVWYRGRES